ncbi:hypothetical protein AOA80_03680 [Methanomassiliicoccales archaeon RumEn M1]|nr:hypothetical protein AOA80_03680 [Methanomassiliicoccales archaeon RumEn M1]
MGARPACYGQHHDDDRCADCALYDACLEAALRQELETTGIPMQHFPAIWEALAMTRESILEATGLELAVVAHIERIRTSHRGREYVKH